MWLMQWLQANFYFLNTEWFVIVYGLLVAANPFAMLPQLVSSIRSEPKRLGGVSVSTFFIFLVIQTAIALGAVKSLDIALFWSMAISATITLAVIVVTLIRRK
jgi:hypothetical protein